jgi:hypothetical protein
MIDNAYYYFAYSIYDASDATTASDVFVCVGLRMCYSELVQSAAAAYATSLTSQFTR